MDPFFASQLEVLSNNCWSYGERKLHCVEERIKVIYVVIHSSMHAFIWFHSFVCSFMQSNIGKPARRSPVFYKEIRRHMFLFLSHSHVCSKFADRNHILTLYAPTCLKNSWLYQLYPFHLGPIASGVTDTSHGPGSHPSKKSAQNVTKKVILLMATRNPGSTHQLRER